MARIVIVNDKVMVDGVALPTPAQITYDATTGQTSVIYNGPPALWLLTPGGADGQQGDPLDNIYTGPLEGTMPWPTKEGRPIPAYIPESEPK